MTTRKIHPVLVVLVVAFYVWIVSLLLVSLNILPQQTSQHYIGREINTRKKHDDKLYLNDREIALSDNADDEKFANALLEQEELVCGVNRTRHCSFNVSDVQWRDITRRSFFLPPAYFDDRQPNDPVIRIIALLPGLAGDGGGKDGPPLPSFYCHIALCSGFVVAIPALIDPFADNLDILYGLHFVSCPVKGVEPNMRFPCNITLLLNYPVEDSPNVTLPVMTWKSREPDRQIAVCVAPLSGDVQPERLAEFVELHKILGVDHFYFYNFTGDVKVGLTSINSNTSAVLHYYTQLGFASSYQWSFPISNQHLSQLAANHHCLYSAMYRYKYVAIVDVDDFVLPRMTSINTWPELLALLDDNTRCGFRFMRSYFQPASDVKWTYPLTMTWTNRTRGVHSKRGKSIVRAERIIEMGVYHMSKTIGNTWTPMTVDAAVAQVHHYATQCVQDYWQSNDCDVLEVDDTARRHERALINNYSHAYRAIFGNDGRSERRQTHKARKGGQPNKQLYRTKGNLQE